MGDRPKISIYTETDIGPMRRQDGRYGYLLEYFPAGGGAPGIRGGTGAIRDATEAQASLAALREALGRVRRPCRITIHTAARQVADALRNGWPEGWARRGWKKAGGREVAHRESWEAVMGLLAPHEYTVTTETHSYRPWLRWELAREEEECLKDLGSSAPLRN